jgi:hypothetical protein
MLLINNFPAWQDASASTPITVVVRDFENKPSIPVLTKIGFTGLPSRIFNSETPSKTAYSKNRLK